MTELHIDFETFSACELKDEGLDNYAKHPSTGVHCMAWTMTGEDEDDDRVDIIKFNSDGTFDAGCGGRSTLNFLMGFIRDGGAVVAHNAAFEFAIWNNVCVPKYGWPPLKIEQMRCTMAQAYAMSLPGSLEKCAAALGVDQQKDMAGARIMMQLAKPKPDGTFWKPADDPAKFQKLYDYCKQDVVVEREIDKRMVRLSDEEQRLWVLDQVINQRGIHVDLPSIEAAIRLVEAEKARLDAAMLRTTGGVVGKCTEVQLLVKWIRERGVEIKGLAKSDVLDSLAGEGLPADVRAVLALRKEAAKSSTAKLLAMKSRASSDGRVRGTKQYHGATTGRWAGRGMQTDNYPRPRVFSHDDKAQEQHILNIYQLIEQQKWQELDMFYGPLMDGIVDGLRGMITGGPGNDLVAVDFSAIEARVLAWLAGQEDVLTVFKTGADIYCHAATGIYNRPITKKDKAERQIGKVAVLALGYGGAVGAFQSMAAVYNVRVPDAQADEIKTAWRQANKKIVHYWHDLESAAINAVEFGCVCKAGPAGRQVAFKMGGPFLWCKLPSGRVICYPYPKVLPVNTPWGEQKHALTFMTELDSTQRKKLAAKLIPDETSFGNWVRVSTYGGSLSENVTQAVARDLLAESIVRLEDKGYPVVMHVHDEVVVEIASDAYDGALHDIEQIMTALPQWATGLPIAAEGWRAKRYRK